MVVLLSSNLLIVTSELTNLLNSKSSTEPLVTPIVFPSKSLTDETCSSLLPNTPRKKEPEREFYTNDASRITKAKKEDILNQLDEFLKDK